MSEYKVALDVYNGPLDLLLFLIRREEIDVHDIPIARITEQYIHYVDMLRQLDPDAVSEFLVLAATLMEIKSRMLLPRPPAEEEDEEIIDPRVELVRQLLEYKKFKDAARYLDDSAAQRAMKHARVPTEAPPPSDEVELDHIDIWDLFDAFNRLLEQTGKAGDVHYVGIDDTPIALHAEDILDSIERAGGSQKFEEVFAGRGKPEMIGLFLALLELIRKKRIRVSQDQAFGTIWIHWLAAREPDDDLEFGDEPIEQSLPGEQADADDASVLPVEQVDALGETASAEVLPAVDTDPPDRPVEHPVDSPELSEPDDETK